MAEHELAAPKPVVQIAGTITRADGTVVEFQATTEKGQGGPGHGDHVDDSGEERGSGCDS
jgi:hypothetical protein